jgi:hypothetical protein
VASLPHHGSKVLQWLHFHTMYPKHYSGFTSTPCIQSTTVASLPHHGSKVLQWLHFHTMDPKYCSGFTSTPWIQSTAVLPPPGPPDPLRDPRCVAAGSAPHPHANAAWHAAGLLAAGKETSRWQKLPPPNSQVSPFRLSTSRGSNTQQQYFTGAGRDTMSPHWTLQC